MAEERCPGGGLWHQSVFEDPEYDPGGRRIVPVFGEERRRDDIQREDWRRGGMWVEIFDLAWDIL